MIPWHAYWQWDAMSMPTIRTKKHGHSTMGVCGNCVHDRHCIYQEISSLPTISCEEHEIEIVPERANSTAPSTIPRSVEGGLCSTCDHLRTCVLRSKEHIIHHCEHYQ